MERCKYVSILDISKNAAKQLFEGFVANIGPNTAFQSLANQATFVPPSPTGHASGSPHSFCLHLMPWYFGPGFTCETFLNYWEETCFNSLILICRRIFSIFQLVYCVVL